MNIGFKGKNSDDVSHFSSFPPPLIIQASFTSIYSVIATLAFTPSDACISFIF